MYHWKMALGARLFGNRFDAAAPLPSGRRRRALRALIGGSSVQWNGMSDVMNGRQKIQRTVARAGSKKAAIAPRRSVFDEVSASEHGHIDVYGHQT